MKKPAFISLLCLAISALGAGEFYRLNLSDLAPGSALVKTDATGKVTTLRPTWGMWPRTPDSIGAAVVERDGVKALEIQKGFQINSSEWSASGNDAQQSVIHTRIKLLLSELSGKGIVGSLRLQQLNNRTAAFIAFEPKGEAFDVLAGNGDGKGGVIWRKAGRVEAGKWFTVDTTLDFSAKTYDIKVADADAVIGNTFRHAADWVGTMWAESLKSNAYRYDIEAANATNVLVSEIVFSSEPILSK